jgi:glycerophosphoryl diester phosphodiesterase
MVGFQGAVEIGADAIETDVHISKDGVVVLSHVRDGVLVRWRRPRAHVYLTGSRPQTVFWEDREDHRLRLELSANAADAERAARAHAAAQGSPQVLDQAWAGGYLGDVGY